MKKILISGALIVMAIGISLSYVQYRHTQQVTAQNAIIQARKAAAAAAIKANAAAIAKMKSNAPSQPFNKLMLSVDDPNSLWVVVNKLRPLQPKDYVPSDLTVPNVPLRLASANSEMQLRAPAATALELMVAAAGGAGAHLMVASGYRSYNLQVGVYGNEVKNYGQATADSESARPGFSEHQTGLAVDLEPTNRQCEVADCFATTPEGKWLALHASDYGFIQRYSPDKSNVTGYRAEAWHYRYVGADLANELKKEGVLTLEEFFNVPAAPNYAS